MCSPFSNWRWEFVEPQSLFDLRRPGKQIHLFGANRQKLVFFVQRQTFEASNNFFPTSIKIGSSSNNVYSQNIDEKLYYGMPSVTCITMVSQLSQYDHNNNLRYVQEFIMVASPASAVRGTNGRIFSRKSWTRDCCVWIRTQPDVESLAKNGWFCKTSSMNTTFFTS